MEKDKAMLNGPDAAFPVTQGQNWKKSRSCFQNKAKFKKSIEYIRRQSRFKKEHQVEETTIEKARGQGMSRSTALEQA